MKRQKKRVFSRTTFLHANPAVEYASLLRPRYKPKFQITMFLSFIGSVASVAYIVWKVPPTPTNVVLLILLVGYIVSVLVSLILFKVSKPRGHEAEKIKFRRQYKTGIVAGLVVVLALVIQKIFDII